MKEGQLVTTNKRKQGAVLRKKERNVVNLKFGSSWVVQWLKSLPAPICIPLAFIGKKRQKKIYIRQTEYEKPFNRVGTIKNK